MIAAAAAADRNLMIVLNGTRPWPCLGKYLFKIPHATAHMKRKREEWRELAPLGQVAAAAAPTRRGPPKKSAIDTRGKGNVAGMLQLLAKYAKC